MAFNIGPKIVDNTNAGVALAVSIPVSLSENYGTTEYSEFPSTLEGYCDTNWISDSNERKSTSDYVFTVGGGAVSWRSAKQTIIARSTMESDFMNLELAVLSAVNGLKLAAPSVMTEGIRVWISIAILIVLFMFQRLGTDKVGGTFAYVLCVWFISIAGIGIYNIAKYDPTVFKALNPKYIIEYFKRNKKNAWISIGGVVMCITGAEALFADVGHFSMLSVQISMCFVTYPALIVAYLGQGAFLRKHIDDVADTFYKSIPQLKDKGEHKKFYKLAKAREKRRARDLDQIKLDIAHAIGVISSSLKILKRMLGRSQVETQSRFQKCIALSTTEAEYIAATEAGKEIVWLKLFLQKLDLH
ncbi:hypothetical protein FXO37_00737 [Capsicum annuum]|nr:hypothetical protein FXO37_00737 [Capsicum annuum]